MFALEIIKALNAREAAKSLPHNQSGFDSAGNKGGIQGHSQGPVFPIVEYVKGNGSTRVYLSKAPFAPGCELEASDFEGCRKNSELLKKLEQLADKLVKVDGRSYAEVYKELFDTFA